MSCRVVSTRHLGILAAVVVVVSGIVSLTMAQSRSGGTLTIVQAAEPLALVSAVDTSTAIGIISTKIHEGLLDYDFMMPRGCCASGFELRPRPALAESWSVAPDGKTYTFRLRRDVTWHDGMPFSAADVKFSLEEIWKKVHPRGRVTFNAVSAVDTPDSSTVVVELSQPTPSLLSALSAHESPVLPKHVYDGHAVASHPAIKAPIGTGPFVFAEWKKGDYIRLVKNPKYWDKGKPHLDAIVVRVIPDAASRAAAFEKGEVQYGAFNPVPLADVKRLTGLTAVKAETAGYEYFSPMHVMEVNVRSEPLRDQRVRHAIMHALDRKFMADTIWSGFAKPAIGPIGSSSPLYTTQTVPHYAYDPARANAILDETGQQRGAGNMRFKISLAFTPVQAEVVMTAEYVKQALARVGIDVDLKPLDAAALAGHIGNREFGLALNTRDLMADPTLGVQPLYVSGNVKMGAPFANAGGYENRFVDSAFAAAQTENTPGKRKALFAQAYRLIQADLPILNLLELSFVTLYNAKVINHTMGADGPYGSFKDAHFRP